MSFGKSALHISAYLTASHFKAFLEMESHMMQRMEGPWALPWTDLKRLIIRKVLQLHLHPALFFEDRNSTYSDVLCVAILIFGKFTRIKQKYFFLLVITAGGDFHCGKDQWIWQHKITQIAPNLYILKYTIWEVRRQKVHWEKYSQ